ncbi:MAG: hypothetical protein C5B59_09935 [Bacteroidetes bacterium]|nr:MAG: hypothetical protein C5B59_09935 [Bacteroidota bacterium]
MKWKCLVLGGGGPVGEFQIGAIQAIARQYDSFDLYIGVGCGSLNSAALAQFNSLTEGSQILTSIWDGIKHTKDIFSVPFAGGELAALAALVSDAGWARDSIYGYAKLTEQIKKNIDWNRIKDKTNWATEITSLNDGQRYTVTNNKKLLDGDTNPLRTVRLSLDPRDPFFIGTHIYELMTAGGCTPLMLPPVDLFNHRFVEGGVRNCTPFPLAVKAFEVAMSAGYDEAEFIVVGNYVNEPSRETFDQLDSGMEIIGRTIKMMTIQIAQDEIFYGKSMLEKMGVKNTVIVIEPTVDYRLSPFNFNDMNTRLQIRNHGVNRANVLLPPPPAKPAAMMAENMISLNVDMDQLLDQLSSDPDNEVISDRIVGLALSGQVPKAMAANQMISRTPMAAAYVKTAPHADAKHPANLGELMDLMTTAAATGKKIKAVGAGFAFDDIDETTGVQIQLDKLSNMWTPDPSILKDPASAPVLLEFESGSTIDQLNKFLWDRGLALVNQTGYEGLSYVGAGSCGGHGSGIRIGPLADAICAINILHFDKTGKLVHSRIEAANGISDRASFEKLYPQIELIQDDDSFNACKVSVGLMGIIYSVTTKTQPRFYLEETRIIVKWSDLKQQLTAKLADEGIHSIHIWFNPYPLKGDIYCVLSEYRRVENRANIGNRGLGVTFGLVPTLAPLILWVMEHFSKNLAAIMNSTLKATVNKYPYVMPCTEALNFGTPNLVSVDATNCGIPAESAIEVAGKLFEFAARRYQEGKFITSPIGFRFVAASDALFAPQSGRATCMIEMPLIKPTPGAQDTIDQFLQTLIKDYHGRPHWGQRLNKNVNPGNIGTMYPKLQTFERIFNQFNNSGIFHNEFSDKIGLGA